MEKMTSTQKNILFILSLPLLCLCLTFLALISPEPAPPATPTVPPPPTVPPAPTAVRHESTGATYHCRQYIKDRLVSPSSAEFSYEETFGRTGKPDNYHAVTGIVESQNRMGVLLQSRYRCDVHYLPDQPMSWVLDYLDIDD